MQALLKKRLAWIGTACAIAGAAPGPASAQPAQSAVANGPCAQAINAAAWAVVNVKCNYGILPAKWQKVIENLIAQYRKLATQTSGLQKSDQSQDRGMQALNGRVDALEQDNAAARDLLAAVFVQIQSLAAAPNATAEVKTAAATLEKGDVSPAIQFLGRQAQAEQSGPKADTKSAAALLIQQSALLQTQDLMAAKQAAERALSLDPSNETVLFTAAALAFVTGDTPNALKHYQRLLDAARARLAARPGDALLTHDVAAALYSVASTQFALSDFKAAEQSLTEAARLLEGLLQRDPNNAEWRRMLGFSYGGIGDVQTIAGQADQALASYEKAFQIAKKLADQFPSDPVRYELAGRYERIAALQAYLGKPDEAIASLHSALDLLGPIIAASPQVDIGYADKSNILGQIATIEMTGGKMDDAIANFRAALQIAQQRLSLNPNAAFWQRAVEVAYAGLGDAQISRLPTSPQDLAAFTGEALESYIGAYDVAKRLAEQHPENSQWKLDLWSALSRLARVKMARGEALVALDYLQQGIGLLKELVSSNVNIAAYRGQLGTAYWQIGTAKLMQGQAADATAQLRLSVGELREAMKLSPKILQFQHDLAVGYFSLGQAQFMTGDSAASLASLREALDLRRQLHSDDPSNGLWEVELLLTEVSLGGMPSVSSAEKIDILKAAHARYLAHSQAGRQPPVPPSTLESIDGQLRSLGAMP